MSGSDDPREELPVRPKTPELRLPDSSGGEEDINYPNEGGKKKKGGRRRRKTHRRTYKKRKSKKSRKPRKSRKSKKSKKSRKNKKDRRTRRKQKYRKLNKKKVRKTRNLYVGGDWDDNKKKEKDKKNYDRHGPARGESESTSSALFVDGMIGDVVPQNQVQRITNELNQRD